MTASDTLLQSEQTNSDDTEREDADETAAQDNAPKSGDETQAEEEEQTPQDGNTAPEPNDEPVLVEKPLTTPSPEQQSNIISGLAQTIPAGKTLLLTIARLKESDELLVTVQPAISDDDKVPAKPLQVQGTADEIDAGLVDALAHYVPARKLALQTAEEIAQAQTKAAEKARSSAAKATTSKTVPPKKSAHAATPAKPARPNTGSITINVDPKNAKLVVRDAKNNEHPVEAGKETSLPYGKYTMIITADEHKTKMDEFFLATKPETRTYTLEKAEPSLFSVA